MTDTLSTPENIAAVAGAFAALLRRDLTPEQWVDMRDLNATPQYGGGVCASHDFIDANETMAEAFALIVGREPNFGPNECGDSTLWNEAWGRAADLYLTAES